MKTKPTKTTVETALGLGPHLLSKAVCLGAIILIYSSARAQNLFVSGSDASGGKIFEFTPSGVQSIFASGLSSPGALAFDSAGNLFVADVGDFIDGVGAALYKLTPNGVKRTVVSWARDQIAPERRT